MTGIKSLKLGNVILPINIIQGPLAGVSCAPFRRLTWKYSQPAFSCTEMISCKSILHQSAQSLDRFVKIDPEEGPVCFQLSGNNPLELAEAVKRVTDLGANFIDLNCGCPVKKIRNKGAGSKLLTDPSQLYQLITAMKQNTHVPISIKIRVQSQNLADEQFNASIATVVSDAGADFLVVHGRHWTEHYETPCRHDEIQFFVQELKMPVIGNGDIACVDSLKKMLATGCAGVMIGRAGVGQPWLIKKLISEINQESVIDISLEEICAVFIEHIRDLSKLLNGERFALLHARKFAKYYARPLKNRMELCEAVNQCENLIDFEKVCLNFFK